MNNNHLLGEKDNMLLPKFRLHLPLRLLSPLSILLLLGLVACAENATPTAPGTTPTKTQAPATTSNTTAKTPAGSSGSASVGAGKLNLPDTTAVTLDPTLQSVLKSFLTPANSNTPDLALTIYASNDEPPTLGENVDKALIAAGYTFHDVRGSNDTALTIRDQDGAGAYIKSGMPDLIIEARESGALTDTSAMPPGVSADVYQKMVDQIKGKKSVLIVLGGTNLYQSIINAKNNTTVGATFDTGATPTPGPTK